MIIKMMGIVIMLIMRIIVVIVIITRIGTIRITILMLKLGLLFTIVNSIIVSLICDHE